jgi:hypothetical protein
MGKPLRVLFYSGFVLFVVTACAGGSSAPDAERYSVRVREVLTVYNGPGVTYASTNNFRSGIEVTLVERNFTGDWVRVIGAEGEIDGWALTGLLDTANVALSKVEVTGLGDANPARVDDSLKPLYAAPVVPTEISRRARDVYRDGQRQGRDASVVMQVGDSNSANPRTLAPLKAGNITFGPYDFLRDAAEHFRSSPVAVNLAAVSGSTARLPLESAPPDADCPADDTRLTCAYRAQNPAVALVMFGPNDVRALSSDEFESALRGIVESSIDAGVLPVLFTFAATEADTNWVQIVRFNTLIIDVARETEMPLVNLWAAAQALPGDGLGSDFIHLTESGEAVDLAGSHPARYGVSLYNLLVLRMLDVIYEDVIR